MITATISTYNREHYLPQVLDSLKRQSLSKDRFEIILVDNNSPGNTKEIAMNFKNDNPEIAFEYYLETNQGLSYGRNRGIKESKGKYVTFIDDDAFLADDYLEVIYNYFENNCNVVAIGSKILLHYESVIPDWENKYLNSLLGFFNIGDKILRFPKTDYPRGSNMSFKTSVFNEVGEFNVDLGRKGGNLAGSEEKDMFMRIYKHKDMLVDYIPNALVYHCVPIERTTTEFIKRQALGTGKSEAVRIKSEGISSIIKRYVMEGVKWGGSLALFFIYLFKGQFPKGRMIVKFRWWVSKGLFNY